MLRGQAGFGARFGECGAQVMTSVASLVPEIARDRA
jgi:hypothetical protein